MLYFDELLKKELIILYRGLRKVNNFSFCNVRRQLTMATHKHSRYSIKVLWKSAKYKVTVSRLTQPHIVKLYFTARVDQKTNNLNKWTEYTKLNYILWQVFTAHAWINKYVGEYNHALIKKSKGHVSACI